MTTMRNDAVTECRTSGGSSWRWLRWANDVSWPERPRRLEGRAMTSQARLVGGRYEVGELLGRGGMADVRRGNDIRLGRTVAIKMLRADLACDPTFQARFRREAQSAASLNHPAIVVRLRHRRGPDPKAASPCRTSSWSTSTGQTLRDLLREGRKILPERALEITSGVLERARLQPPGRHRAPRHQARQRDADPAGPGQGDGLRHRPRDRRHPAHMTQTAAVMGTAQYLSPEQARGEKVDARCDLYSTGCLLYELLTGRPPFVGDSPVSVAYQHVREQPEPPSSFDPDIPPAVDAVVLKALAKNRDERYQSASEMRAGHRPRARRPAGDRADGRGRGDPRDGRRRRSRRRRRLRRTGRPRPTTCSRRTTAWTRRRRRAPGVIVDSRTSCSAWRSWPWRCSPTC